MEIIKVVKPFTRRGWSNTFDTIVYVFGTIHVTQPVHVTSVWFGCFYQGTYEFAEKYSFIWTIAFDLNNKRY